MEAVQFKFKFLLLIFLTSFLLVPSIQAQDFQNCTNENYQVTTTRATVSLDPVVGGKRITFTLLSFAVGEQVPSQDELLDAERLDFVKSIQLSSNGSSKELVLRIATRLDRDQTIFEGEVVIDLSFKGVHFHSEKYVLCVDLSCPISEGNFQYSFSQVLSVNVAPGNYNFMMRLLSKDGRRLSCVTFDFTIPYQVTFDIPVPYRHLPYQVNFSDS